MDLMRKCIACGAYSLSQECRKCGGETRTPHPAKYSPEDKYAAYRRKAKYG